MRSGWWIIGLSVSILLAVLSPLASILPDGLDRFAEDQNFSEKAVEPAFSVMPGFSFPGIDNGAVATIIAGLLGTLLLFGLGVGLASILRSRHET